MVLIHSLKYGLFSSHALNALHHFGPTILELSSFQMPLQTWTIQHWAIFCNLTIIFILAIPKLELLFSIQNRTCLVFRSRDTVLDL